MSRWIYDRMSSLCSFLKSFLFVSLLFAVEACSPAPRSDLMSDFGIAFTNTGCNNGNVKEFLRNGLRRTTGYSSADFQSDRTVAASATAISCHGTITQTTGQSTTGTATITKDAAGEFKIAWVPDPAGQVVQPRKSQETQTRELLENAQRSDACATKVSVVIEASAMKSQGYSQSQTAEELVAKYAYGRGGQVYRGSAGAEAVLRSWVTEVYRGKYPVGMNFQIIYVDCMAGR